MKIERLEPLDKPLPWLDHWGDVGNLVNRVLGWPGTLIGCAMLAWLVYVHH